MYRNCTKSCACSLENVVQDLHTDQQHPIIMVNCSGRGLKDLPTQLPLYTRILHLERNEITDLRPLKSNPMFESLWDLYLDNNTVTSISYLEGSHWLQNFRVFSLRGNQLQKVGNKNWLTEFRTALLYFYKRSGCEYLKFKSVDHILR